MNRDDPEKHGAASRRFGNDMSGNDTIGDGIDLMRSDMEWKGVAAHRAELARSRHDQKRNGKDKSGMELT